LTLNGGKLNGVGTINLVGTTLDVLAGGLLGGSRSIIGNVNNIAGTVSPGASPGIMTINGDYFQGPQGTLLAELGGTVAGAQYDQLIDTGTVTLGGTLAVSLVNGFVPAPGDAFKVIQSPTVSGSFSSAPQTAQLLTTQVLPSSVDLVAGSPASVTESLINPQINQTNTSPPAIIENPSSTSGTFNSSGPVVTAYLETTGGQFVPLSSNAPTPSGVYTNVDTGQTTIITENSLPPPGVYINQDDRTVLVVTMDEVTGRVTAMVGTTEGGRTDVAKATVRTPGTCK